MSQVTDAAVSTTIGLWATQARRPEPLRVAVLSNHELVRAGLSRFLSRDTDGFWIVEGRLGAGHVGSHDVVVYDLTDDSGHPLKALAALLAEGATVVALTSAGKSHLAETALAMGVAETVPLDIEARGFAEALRRAAAGQTTTPEAHRRRRRDAARAGARLTEREAAVLELVGAGLTNQEITERLHISVNTLKTYIRSAYRKIGVSRRAQAVLWAAQHGLTPAPDDTPALRRR
jgi:DNA-binding NarL/FixJ family response regulator